MFSVGSVKWKAKEPFPLIVGQSKMERAINQTPHQLIISHPHINKSPIITISHSSFYSSPELIHQLKATQSIALHKKQGCSFSELEILGSTTLKLPFLQNFSPYEYTTQYEIDNMPPNRTSSTLFKDFIRIQSNLFINYKTGPFISLEPSFG